MKFTTSCNLRADLRIRLATHRNPYARSGFANLRVLLARAFGVTTEYTAFLEAPPKKRWIRGYAVKLDLPSPYVFEALDEVDTRIRSEVRPPLPLSF